MTPRKGRRASPPTPASVEARDLFVVKGLSIRAVSEAMAGRKGCGQRQLQRRSTREKWMEQRHKYVAKETAKTHEAAAETGAAIRARHLAEYSQVGQIARMGLLKVAQRIQSMTVILPDDADALNKLARTLDLAQKGQRIVADTADDRVTAVLDAAAILADGKIDDIEDWNPDEELSQAMTPKQMDDLSYGQESKATKADENGKLREGVRALTTPPEPTEGTS